MENQLLRNLYILVSCNLISMLDTERVIFDKPDTILMSRQGYNLVDMHTHTKYSDTLTRVKSLLKVAKKRRVGVAITDHNAIGGVVEAYKNNNSLLVVPGIEVTCSSEATFCFTSTI